MDEFNDFKFDWIENSVVASMLITSFLIGLYYTFCNKQETFVDYMLGGRNMGIFPVAMSLVASSVSGLSILGIPTEIYLYGTQVAAANFTLILLTLVIGVFYLPVYYKLQLDSHFEYLQLRFNKHVRILGITLFSLLMIMFLPLVIYIPAVCLNQVTGLSVYSIAFGISGICIFYTTFGGLKAVLWTDVLQNMFTFFGMVFAIIVSCFNLGGVSEIWRINKEGGRLEMFNMDPNPLARNTLWASSIGYFLNYLCILSVVPASVQRYLAVPTLTKARWTLFYVAVCLYIVLNLTTFFGMILYARYYQCDPVAAGVIKSSSQMVPLYISEVGKNYPGLAGLFVSGILSASLSSVSSWLNSIGGMLYKDIKDVYFPNVHHSEGTEFKIIRAVVITLGIASLLLIFVVDKLGTIFQLGITIFGTVLGSTMALFSLGMFFPRANTKGAVTGAIASFFLSGWIIFGAQYYIMTGKLKFPGKITSIDNCPTTIMENFNSSTSLLFNYTGVGSPVVADSSVALIYQLSYNYYVVIGLISGIVVGLVVSLLTEPPDIASLSPDLFTPCVHRFLPKKRQDERPDKASYELARNHENVEVVMDF
ncbi:sodium-coupled monocarboxylate transporter 1-like [Homalodisca vitripennis]|uniref:sodium-coupled monocarboxylate transporter 1-like n=1 Tax=Homalodisca vitripennis TaxID=197043 RepID=UPI001EEBA77D|nr:sodium-coupled monocarboxylate transporter 1-like [Homalodisca vitripennis]